MTWVVFGGVLVRAYVAVLPWCVVFLDTSLAISEFSVLLCVGGGLRLLIWGI